MKRKFSIFLSLWQSQLASATLRKIFEKRFGWGEKI